MSGVEVCCSSSGWDLIQYILYCHILWWIFYYFLLVVTRQSEEWCCRFLTLFHGCLVSYSAIKDILVNKSPIDFQSLPLSQQKKNYLSYMLSYFLFDFCWIHFFGNETWVIYAHHVASILIIINVLVKNYGGAGVSYGVAGLELTNPYLQLRWFLRTHGQLNKPIHTITELWFMFLFFVIRMIGGTVLLYYAVVRSRTDYGMKLCFLSIYGISLVLQWQIFVYFKKKYLSNRNLRSVTFINSRVSISPYFQRRTLDHPGYDPGEDTEKEDATIVMAMTSDTVSDVISTKAMESSIKMVVDNEDEISAKIQSIKTERPFVMKEGASEEGAEENPEEPPEENPEENPEE